MGSESAMGSGLVGSGRGSSWGLDKLGPGWAGSGSKPGGSRPSPGSAL